MEFRWAPEVEGLVLLFSLSWLCQTAYLWLPEEPSLQEKQTLPAMLWDLLKEPGF